MDFFAAGMAEMNEKYKEFGNNLYPKDIENLVNPLEGIDIGLS